MAKEEKKEPVKAKPKVVEDYVYVPPKPKDKK